MQTFIFLEWDAPQVDSVSLGHLLDVQKVTGSNLVRPTFQKGVSVKEIAEEMKLG